jgi:hypothetical protein
MHWYQTLIALRDWFRLDATLATLTAQTEVSGTVAQIHVGVPPVAAAPCIWLARGRNGESGVKISDDGAALANEMEFTIELWRKVPNAANITAGLAAAYQEVSTLEEAVVASLKGFFAGTRKHSTALGARYACEIIRAIPLASDSGTAAVGSLLTIGLNKGI